MTLTVLFILLKELTEVAINGLIYNLKTQQNIFSQKGCNKLLSS